MEHIILICRIMRIGACRKMPQTAFGGSQLMNSTFSKRILCRILGWEDGCGVEGHAYRASPRGVCDHS